MNTSLILVMVIVVVSGVAFYGWKRAARLKKTLRNAEAKLISMSRNLEALRIADRDDEIAQSKLLEIDREIVNAKTPIDAARIRRRFVSGAYSGM